MSKFFLGFIVCLGMVIGCGAADNTAVSRSDTGTNSRLVVVDQISFQYNSLATILRDTKSSQEFLCVTRPDAIQIIRVYNK